VEKKKSSDCKLDSFFKALTADLDVLDARHTLDPRVKYAAARLRLRMRKRAQYVRPGMAARCIDEYLSFNASLPDVTLDLNEEIVNNAREFIEHALTRYTYSVDQNDYGCLSKEHFESLWKFGPGASHGVDGTHAAIKIRQKMSCTESCRPLVTNLRLSNPYFSAFDCVNDGGTTVVSGSRLSTAPKNEDTVRIIAIEPSGNMVLQLAAGRYIEGALRYIGVDITKQEPLNKALALLGSITGGVATLDLSKASDRILPLLIRRLWPSNWYNLLVRLRSPTTEASDGSVHVLHMMSTMGNGFTFPMMTLTLLALIYANRAVHHSLKRRLYIDYNMTGVYGDDMIVPAHESGTLINVLTSAGLVVNVDKSYTEGPFRESCGGDYYKGWDVTPFYVEKLETHEELYVALNKMCEWCGEQGVLLPLTVNTILRMLDGPPLLVPEWHNPTEGWLCTQVSAKYKYLSSTPMPLALCDCIFDTSLAVGGYIQQRIEPTNKKKGKSAKKVVDPSDESWGAFKPVEIGATRVVCFEATCRESPIVTRLRSSRLPRGYLDGRDAVKRTVRVAAWIQLIVSLSS
jgi:hypothetical protein